MSKRPYGQSRDVPIAEFSYRHEAEFAAGFLSDGGIPFRLQVDDAGGADAGVTIARPAVLWVRPEDAEQARDILEIGGETREPSATSFREGWALPGQPPGTSLSAVERGVAFGLCVLFFGAALWALDSSQTTLGYLALVVGGLFGGSSLLGVTIPPIKGLLRAMSGVAP